MVRGMRHFKKDRPQKEVRRSPMSILEDKMDALRKDMLAKFEEHGKKVDQLLKQVKLGVSVDRAALNQGEIIMAELDDLTAQVAKNTDVEESAVVLINGIAAKLAAAIAAGNPAALTALQASLTKSADDLSAAIVANTPAAPTP
jgi:hypothetical protein